MGEIRNIAVLGTGLMGFPMALNLLAAGHRVAVWNRSPDKAERLRPSGATVALSPAEAVTDAEVVISMVADGVAVAALLSDAALLASLAPQAVWIDMSSAKPEEARAFAEILKPLGKTFLDAPVSGGTAGAEAASLAIMVGGDPGDFGGVEALLSAMGRPVRVGPVGAGQLAKLANQAIVAVTIAAVAEATLLLERGGADPVAVRLALQGGFADSTILQQHGARMTRRDFEPGGLSRLQLKDLNNVLTEADTAGINLPIVHHVTQRFTRYVNELGGSERDHSGLFEELLDLQKS